MLTKPTVTASGSAPIPVRKYTEICGECGAWLTVWRQAGAGVACRQHSQWDAPPCTHGRLLNLLVTAKPCPTDNQPGGMTDATDLD